MTTMEYGIWNFHGGLWPANGLAAFNGTTLTPITGVATCADAAGFAITAGLLNPLVTAATYNTECISPQSDETSESNGSQTTTNDASNNESQQTQTDTCTQFTSDLSNACDDNAVDNHLKIENQIGFLAQQYAPVYNLVLGHFTNQNIQTFDTDDSSDEEESQTTENSGQRTSKDQESRNTPLSEQPSKSLEGISISTPTVAHELLNCPVAGCDYKVSQISILEQHVARHGDKPVDAKKGANMQRIRYEREEYHCTMCPYTCTTERAYLRHLRMHSMGEAPHGRLSCAVCGRDRAGESAMARHMRKHRDDRFFCCDICVFRTVQLKKLIQHRRMHTGEKPHLCPHCTYRSARRDNLRSHVRRVHKRDNIWCDTFSPRGMLLTPSASKVPPAESQPSNTLDEHTSAN